MKARLIITATIASLAFASWTTTSFADDASADCEVRERGEKKKGLSLIHI